MEPPEIPGKNTCQEEIPEPEMEPAIDNCRETPGILDTDICQVRKNNRVTIEKDILDSLWGGKLLGTAYFSVGESVPLPYYALCYTATYTFYFSYIYIK
ncbi:hypothetical protein XENTR_v10016798 [Xenopus tropicalis]|nr:hypothetical protein XENTR_v10016798 [Xenopus tropicalis]